MAANSVFVQVQERGWRRGLRNLLRAGFAEWWMTNTWWVHALIWSGVLNLMLAGIVLSGDAIAAMDGVGFLSLFGGLFPTVAVVIILQGAIVGEKQNGTAAWVLSKPVSRIAYILGKLVPNAVSMPVAMLLIPMVIGFGLLNVAGVRLSLGDFLLGFLVVALNMLFYVALTVMLGAIFKKRGGVIAIPLALLFGQQYLISAVPVLTNVLPWGLALPRGGEITTSVAASLMLGRTPPTLLPVGIALVATALFVVLAVWRFRDVEL
ncbi:MAG: ABC transporter permease [Anaerolineae bacterium]